MPAVRALGELGRQQAVEEREVGAAGLGDGAHDQLRSADVADAVLEADDLRVLRESHHGLDRVPRACRGGRSITGRSVPRRPPRRRRRARLRAADEIRRQHEQSVGARVGRCGRPRPRGRAGRRRRRPRARGRRRCATATRTTVAASLAESAWNSPVPQAGNTPPGACSSGGATWVASRSSSTRPAASNGVTGKKRMPSKSMRARPFGCRRRRSSVRQVWVRLPAQQARGLGVREGGCACR